MVSELSALFENEAPPSTRQDRAALDPPLLFRTLNLVPFAAKKLAYGDAPLTRLLNSTFRELRHLPLLPAEWS